MTDIERIEELKRLAEKAKDGTGGFFIDPETVLWLIAQIPQWRPTSELPDQGRWILIDFGDNNVVPHFYGGCSTLKHAKQWCYIPTPPTEAPREEN